METIDIGFTINDRYAQHMAAGMASILCNAKPETNFNFYVLNAGDITFDSKRRLNELKQIHDFNIYYVNVNNDDFREYKFGSHISTNYRIKLPSLLPHLDKILFMDVDLVVMEDLSDLWNTDIENYYMAAVADPCQNLQKERVTSKFPEKFPPKMFNIGVTLLNLKKWREDKIEDKILEGMKWFSATYERCWPDQSVMNMIQKDAIKVLPGRYNACPLLAYVHTAPFSYDDQQECEEVFKSPAIVHYAAAPDIKAWLMPELPYADLYWKYLRLTPFYEMGIAGMIEEQNKRLLQQLGELR